MDKFKITIFIETSIHGPAIRSGSAMYMIEYIKQNGDPETRQGIITKESATENQLAMMAMIEALQRLTKPCEIRISTECEHILNVMRNCWLPQWKKNNWRNAKGKEIKNVELWQQISDQLDKHIATFSKDHNSYASIMQQEMEKEDKK